MLSCSGGGHAPFLASSNRKSFGITENIRQTVSRINVRVNGLFPVHSSPGHSRLNE